MPLAITPALPAGALSSVPQPVVPVCGGELLLRPWAAADAAVLRAAFRDEAIRRWHMRHVTSPAEARERIAAAHRSWQEERDAEWAIARADGGEVLGRAGLRRMDLVHGEAECAYWVLPQARGTGVAPRALTALAAWALDEAGFHRLELAHSTANEPSCRVAAKCGFPLEGTRRSAHRQPDGWHDMHLHARVQGED